jgi:hypothetical protein
VPESHVCPNCGANIRDDGVSDFLRCRFCETQITVVRTRWVSRAELEAEREQLLARERDADARIRQAGTRGVEDFLVPPLGCCGLYFALFVVGMLILGAMGLKESEPHTTGVAAIAIGAALVGVVLIIWRRETRRRERVVALERERAVDRELREERLREIESALE